MNTLNTDAGGRAPESFSTEEELDEFLTRPSDSLVRFIRTLSSPVVILGAGGKMGPTLAVMARRAARAAEHALEVIAVSRFSDAGARAWLERQGVTAIGADLLHPEALQQLPDARTVIYLVGQKFGTGKTPGATWAMNVLVPARVAERYPRATLVALSTGNVYPLSPVTQGGAVETDALAPAGEYAMTAMGRERIFEFYSARGDAPMALLRLCYAVELRYGVLVDIAQKVHAGDPIDLANGFFNCIWQGDANDMVLRAASLAATPPSVWNLCRPEIYPVRAVAAQLGALLDREPVFAGTENPTALLANPSRLCAALGTPATPLEAMLRWIASWVRQGGRTLGKPTHFEVRDGKY